MFPPVLRALLPLSDPASSQQDKVSLSLPSENVKIEGGRETLTA